MSEYGRVECIAPGCRKRKVKHTVVEGIRFCNEKCAQLYVEMMARHAEHTIERFRQLRSATLKLDETWTPPSIIIALSDEGQRVRL